MRSIPPYQREAHEAFHASPGKHVLMLTIHGTHEWRVVPGLPDTGGQNVFVNQFSNALAGHGFKVTIANRGGYLHPKTGSRLEGLNYRDNRQRLLYLEDGDDHFVRKEDMGDHVSALADNLLAFTQEDGCRIDYIVSHYWDAAQVGTLLGRRGAQPIPHVWVPHSLGEIKKRNVAPERWNGLRIEERIEAERGILAGVRAVAATSATIRESLITDYGYGGTVPFLPPCVDPDRYHPRQVQEVDELWEFLAQRAGISAAEIRDRLIVTEISRTDTTKRKDVLIRAFARAHQDIPNSFLIVSIDESNPALSAELRSLIAELGIANEVAVVGTVWERLPRIYAVTDVYCTPSIMEGFGMSVQEAAATGVPILASHLVPFASEYLLGADPEEVTGEGGAGSFMIGKGAIVVEAEAVDGFAHALIRLLSDRHLRWTLGERAYQLTIPYFTWPSRSKAFIEAVGMEPGEA